MIKQKREGWVYPKTWWYKLAARCIPSRCREIPEARNPDRILLRQVALIKGHCYLQQFASHEDPMWMHSHPWTHGTIAIGLWGGLQEHIFGGVRVQRKWRAPYARYMGPNYVHSTDPLGPGHTSIFIGLGRKTDEKYYHRVAGRVHWTTHIKRKVVRL
jgi:hypothetical protein